MNATYSSNALVTQAEKDTASVSDFVTMTVFGQLFGIPILQIQDILDAQRITRVPLAPAEIVGSLNLRGRIVTAIDMRLRLGMPARSPESSSMSVVVQHEDDLYSLIVDQVGEVMSLPRTAFEKDSSMLPARWKDVMMGIYRLDSSLMAVVDVARFLDVESRPTVN